MFLDYALFLELFHISFGVTEPFQDFPVVFTQFRCNTGLELEFGEFPGEPDHFNFPCFGMIDFGDVIIGNNIGIFRSFKNGVDRRANDVKLPQCLDPVIPGISREDLIH